MGKRIVAALAAAALCLPVAADASEGPSPWPPPVYACHIDDVTGVYFGWAEAPGAVDVSLVCHFYSGWRHVQVGAVSAASGAVASGRITGWIGPSWACAEVHVTYLDGAWHRNCP